MKIDRFYIVRAITKVKITRIIALFFARLFSKESHIPYKKTVFNNLDISTINREMKQKGYALGINLPKDMVDEILEFCKKNETIVDFDKTKKRLIPFNDENNPEKGSNYKYTNTYQNCEAIKKIAHDPKIIAVAKEYLGCHPKFIGSQMWWSYSKLDEKGKKMDTPLYGYHYDIDDLKFIKLFIYLNDVDMDRGPHVIIGETHKSKDYFEIKNRRLSDELAEKRYGNQINVITGKAGTGFFEDTFCYHKGTHPNKRRLLLQFEYAVNDFGNHDNG